MACSYLHQISTILLVGITLYLADGTPVNQFSATSYTSDSNGSHSVVVNGDDTGTKVGVGSGPPAPASYSDSSPILGRFASPITPRPNQVYFIPAGQDQTISSGNTVIQTRMGSSSGTGSGSGSSSQITQVSSSNDGASQSFAAGAVSHQSNKSSDDDYYNNDGFDK